MKLTNLTSLSMMTAVVALVLMATGASAYDLRPGETVRGEVAGAGAVEVFDIDLAAGDEIRIKIRGKGVGGCAPAIEILDPDGATVASAENERKLKLVYEATETGTHQIRLRTDSASSSHFKMKVRGDKRRSYSDRTGALAFGVRAGSRISVKVKAKSGASLELYDSAGDDTLTAYSGSGRKAKAVQSAAAETDEYGINFGGARAKAKVKVTYPAPRAALNITMTPAAGGGGSYTPATAQDAEDPQDPEDPEDPAENPDDNTGEVADGTVDPGNGTVPNAPAPMADHAYLTALLAEAADAELSRVRMELKHRAGESVEAVANALVEAIDDAIADQIHEALALMFDSDVMVSEAGIDAMVDLVAAQRRADRAQRGLLVLAQEIPTTALGGDVAYDAGQAAAAAELASLDAAIGYALTHGLMMAVRDDADPAAPSFDAPAAPGASNEIIAGLSALDAAALSGQVMTRARSYDGPAIELAEALYATYEELLSANPTADPNPAQTMAAIQQARAELAGLRQAAFGVEFEIALVSMPQPAANEHYTLDVVAFGPESRAQVEFEVDGAEHVEPTASGIRIQMDGHVEARDLLVRARYAGVERHLEIRIAPGAGEQPEATDVQARLVDAVGQALEGAQWEIRDIADEEIAQNAEGHPLMGGAHADGSILAGRVLAGEWILVIRAEGHDEMRMPLNVEARPDNLQDLGEIIVD